LVSVIVPCRNEQGFIDGCVRSLLEGEYPVDRLEILVVDGRSVDGTREIVVALAAAHGSVRLVDNPRRIIPAAMNCGLAASTGSVIMAASAHCTYSSNYVSELVDALTSTEAACVGGLWQIAPREPRVVGRAVAAVLSHPFGVGNAPYRTGSTEEVETDAVAFGCWPRDVIDRAAPWDERVGRSEDRDIAGRIRAAGGRTILRPAAVATYYARSRMRDVVTHGHSNGYWVTYPSLAFGTRFSTRHFVPGVFVAAVGSAAALAATTHTTWPLKAILGTYGAAATIAAADLYRRRRDLPVAIVAPGIFGTIHVSYGVGSLHGAVVGVLESRLRGRRRPS
jgi:glycosyltransferase involved in cell wall biosynthesis